MTPAIAITEPPGCDLAVAQGAVVLARDVVRCPHGRFALCQGDEPQGGVGRRVAARALQVHLSRIGSPMAPATFMITFHAS
jgi:hypothetical protein